MTESDTRNQAAHFLHRWYDQDHHLSELVRMLEHLSDESQYLVALLMGSIAQDAIELTGKSQFIKDLDWDKIIGILKSKRGRRWYDEEPEMHKAFNLLYSLEDAAKSWVAEQLYKPVLLIQTYEERCRATGVPVDLNIICDIMEVTFKEGNHVLTERFNHLYT